jgi:hypothetical protein
MHFEILRLRARCLKPQKPMHASKVEPTWRVVMEQTAPDNKDFHSTLSLLLSFPRGEVLYSLDPRYISILACLSTIVFPSYSPVLNLSPKEEAKVDHGKQPLDAPQFTEINPCGNCSCIQKNPIFPCMKLEYVVYGEEGRKTYNMGFF